MGLLAGAAEPGSDFGWDVRCRLEPLKMAAQVDKELERFVVQLPGDPAALFLLGGEQAGGITASTLTFGAFLGHVLENEMCQALAGGGYTNPTGANTEVPSFPRR